jgi:hypothetical protein
MLAGQAFGNQGTPEYQGERDRNKQQSPNIPASVAPPGYINPFQHELHPSYGFSQGWKHLWSVVVYPVLAVKLHPAEKLPINGQLLHLTARKLITRGEYVQNLNPALAESILPREFLLIDRKNRIDRKLADV